MKSGAWFGGYLRTIASATRGAISVVWGINGAFFGDDVARRYNCGLATSIELIATKRATKSGCRLAYFGLVYGTLSAFLGAIA